ncbi:MAG: LysM peptidoglycan-binding domain-containing protein [Holophagaceae bacterium]|nr:LysM peptidoglycan-binding domain-containing protein [Holophagaceae bacterium]
MKRGLGGPSLALLLAAGAPLGSQVPAVLQPTVVKSTVPAAPSEASSVQTTHDPKFAALTGIPRLKALVEAAEAAVKVEGEEDWDTASERCDEAEVLTADWPDGTLTKPEVLALLERLHQVQKQLETEEVEAPAGPEPGLLVTEEVITLSGEDLRAEQEKVKSAEKGAVFDFPIDLNSKVLGLVHTFTTEKRGFIENALSRASQWMPMIRQVFAEEGIPQDLAYLAVIESGFRNEARSRAAAVGMWQFIRSTGRIYGLTGNAWLEERRDPVKATRAAARYLKRLREVSGDWYLALAGYNAGPLTPERAIQALGTRNYWDIYRSRFLRNETKNYVPSLCAAILVGRFPERYGLNVAQLRPYVFETVEIERQTSLTVIARLAGTDVGTLRELNPELLRATTPPGRYTLRVPPTLAAPTARALARLPRQQLLEFRSYVIRRGDTVSTVASRFKVSEDDLLATNDMSRSQFKRGRRIQVPPPSAIPIDGKDLLPREERARILGDQPLPSLPRLPGDAEIKAPAAPASAPAPARPIAAATPSAASRPAQPAVAPSTASTDPRTELPTSSNSASVPRYYQARSGDSLASIAQAFGVPLSELVALNPDAARGLAAGTAIHLPDAPGPRPSRPATAPATAPARPDRTHTVRRRETLFSIASMYGTTAAKLREWNRLRGNRVKVGQRLKVSGP